MTTIDRRVGVGDAEFEVEGPDTALHTTIPPEIWLHVFSFLQPPELRSSTLTCSRFRWLAQPLLFTVIDVSPFFPAFNSERHFKRPQWYLARTVRRLEFYRSHHIAPAVKHCWISPYSRAGFPPRSPRDDCDPDLIVEKVVEALPLFPNLCNLTWHCMDLSRWWDVICTLPIRTLWLNSCGIQGVDRRPLPIRHLDLDHWAWEGEATNHVSIHEESLYGVSQSVLAVTLHSEHIEHISIPRDNSCSHLLSTMAAMDAFILLRVLRVPLSAMSLPSFVPALTQCPVLEELRIFNPPTDGPRDITMYHLPLHTLPCLSTFEGPYTYLLDFGMGRPLRVAQIWGLDASSALCDPFCLIQLLRQLSMSNTTLECLHMSVSHIPDELLAITSTFPRLRSLEFSSADSPPVDHPGAEPVHRRPFSSAVTLLYTTLRGIRFPAELENLRITTKLSHGNLDMASQRDEALRLIEFMARAHPRLRTVEIGYGTYWTGTYIARWTRCWLREEGNGGCPLAGTLLGRLVFNEHKRKIVFPDAQRAVMETQSGWVEDKLVNTRSSVVSWLRRLWPRAV